MSSTVADYPLQSQSKIENKTAKSKRFKKQINDLSANKINSASASAHHAQNVKSKNSENSHVNSSIDAKNKAKRDLCAKTISNWD